MISQANLPQPLNGSNNDEFYMQEAIQQAILAKACAEVPVGAIVVYNNEIIAYAHNSPIHLTDPSAHAEILCLRQAAQKLRNYRLNHSTLYVTLEPCMMCVGAMIHARIARLVFATDDPKSGAVVSQARLIDAPFNNHKISYNHGILSQPASELLKEFFAMRRQSSGN